MLQVASSATSSDSQRLSANSRSASGVVAIRPADLQVDVQPGVVYAAINHALRPHGLFFPPSPGGSAEVATIGP